MKKFWKWFFIVLGILVVIAIAFCATMLALRSGNQIQANEYYRGNGFPGGMMGRGRAFGGMMFGMGWMMLVRGLFSLGVLVLAGFGVAHLVQRNKRPALVQQAMLECASCHKPLAPEWKACPHCSAPVQTEAAPVETKTKKAKA
jgi:hypothetical protein